MKKFGVKNSFWSSLAIPKHKTHWNSVSQPFSINSHHFPYHVTLSGESPLAKWLVEGGRSIIKSQVHTHKNFSSRYHTTTVSNQFSSGVGITGGKADKIKYRWYSASYVKQLILYLTYDTYKMIQRPVSHLAEPKQNTKAILCKYNIRKLNASSTSKQNS